MKYAKIITARRRRLSNPLSSTSLGFTVPLSFSATPTRRASLATLCHHAALGHAVQIPLHPQERHRSARWWLSRSRRTFLAIAQANAPQETTVKITEYKEMEPFFVKGGSDEP